jgi:hypothetical protein
MSTKYYNYANVVSKEEFDKERNRIVAERIKEAEDVEHNIEIFVLIKWQDYMRKNLSLD